MSGDQSLRHGEDSDLATSVWTCPNGHPDWTRPTAAQLASQGEDLQFECGACHARWKATAAQRALLVRSVEVSRQLGSLATEAEALSRRIQEAADRSALADRGGFDNDRRKRPARRRR